MSAQVSGVLRKALEAFGPHGENWTPNSRFCSIKSLTKAADDMRLYNTCYQPAYAYLQIAAKATIISNWNDHAKWPEIKRAFKKAIRLAEAA